jgi:hypothetical protein
MPETEEPEDRQPPWPGNREAYLDDGLPGQPLSTLLFGCAEHDEESVIEYYDPDDPPRCSHGDLMNRKAR